MMSLYQYCACYSFISRCSRVSVDTRAVQGWRQLPKSGGGGETLPHLLATSPGLPLLFLKYIMQKGKKNEERNLNACDRSFEKLDNYATHIKLIVVVAK